VGIPRPGALLRPQRWRWRRRLPTGDDSYSVYVYIYILDRTCSSWFETGKTGQRAGRYAVVHTVSASMRDVQYALSKMASLDSVTLGVWKRNKLGLVCPPARLPARNLANGTRWPLARAGWGLSGLLEYSVCMAVRMSVCMSVLYVVLSLLPNCIHLCSESGAFSEECRARGSRQGDASNLRTVIATESLCGYDCCSGCCCSCC
jgi:hypothetical protein